MERVDRIRSGLASRHPSFGKLTWAFGPTRAAMKMKYGGAVAPQRAKVGSGNGSLGVRAKFDRGGVAVPRIVAVSTQDQIESAIMRSWSNPPAQRPNMTSLEDLSRGTQRKPPI